VSATRNALTLAMAISFSTRSDVKSRQDLPAKGHGRAKPGRDAAAADTTQDVLIDRIR